jgi:acetyltransferase-like isoleucine patch superfamily enzyme
MNILNVQNERQTLKNVSAGDGVEIFNFVNAYGCSIGDGTRIGSFVEIQKNAHIGKNCKISSHSFICEGVRIGDSVFVGHGVMFTNDKYPRAVNPDGTFQTEKDWKVIPTEVKDGASIGSGAVILCGVTIGEKSMIGAGSVVTKDVPAGATVAGNPARMVIKKAKGKRDKA